MYKYYLELHQKYTERIFSERKALKLKLLEILCDNYKDELDDLLNCINKLSDENQFSVSLNILVKEIDKLYDEYKDLIFVNMKCEVEQTGKKIKTMIEDGEYNSPDMMEKRAKLAELETKIEMLKEELKIAKEDAEKAEVFYKAFHHS
jgi:hypothetical protein